MDKSQYERAHELAEFVRGYAIANAPSFGAYAKSRYKDSSYQCAYEHLADEIESLGERDGLPYLLDKDGIPIKLGDTVYHEDEELKVHAIHFYLSDDPTLTIIGENYMSGISPDKVAHHKPRTLDDILQDAPKSCSSGEDDVKILDLIREAYELGKKEANNE